MENKTQQNIFPYSLESYNTMGIDSLCPEMFSIKSEDNLLQALEKTQYPIYILGGGSNVLLPDKLDKSILYNTISGIEIVDENEKNVIIEVGAGIVWHEFVQWAVKRDYYGVENLSLIPGTVGAAPIQNIGAYGVEVKDVLMAVRYYDLVEQKWKWKKGEECEFGYRDSIFKKNLRGRIFISKVRFRLSLLPEVNIEYGALKQLEKLSEPLTSQKISEVVIAIRQSKLPDPEILGNCGSFFQNPIVESAFAEAIKEDYPALPYYPMGDNSVKIPAAWMIEACGLKGKRYGNVGCYEKHALVIVNYGGATSQEVREHVKRVQSRVKEKFNILLHPEVNIL